MSDTKVPAKPSVGAGPIAAIVPQNLDEAFRLARALSGAGEMIPKSYRGQEGAILSAIIRGAEVGLAPMQALSNIAVINGRACLWGDALPALMQKHGHRLDVVIRGSGDRMAAVATLLRSDNGHKVVREFSVEDAKAAGLWGKPGPWTQYPARMLSMRARSFACRDGAADALMGLAVAEEVQDHVGFENAVDVTPFDPMELARDIRGRLMDAAETVEALEAAVEAAGADLERLKVADADLASEILEFAEVLRGEVE